MRRYRALRGVISARSCDVVGRGLTCIVSNAEKREYLFATRECVVIAESDELATIILFEKQIAQQKRTERREDTKAHKQEAEATRQKLRMACGDMVEFLAWRDDQHIHGPQHYAAFGALARRNHADGAIDPPQTFEVCFQRIE